jgi:sigma-B regulation protein RsbU (phosphoserine phosphatase)
MGGANLLANFVGVTFAQVVTTNVEQPDVLVGHTPMSAAVLLFSPLAFAFVWITTHRYERPMQAFLNAIADGRNIPDALARETKRRLLNEPFITIALAFGMWCIAALLFSVIHWHHGSGQIAIQRTVYNCLSIGVITVVTAFFLQEHILRHHLAPVVFPEGGLASVPGTLRIRITTRLAALLVACNLLPLASVLLLFFRITGTYPEPRTAINILETAILTYTVVFIAAGIALTVLVGRNLVHPFTEIIEALHEVREGRFNRRVRVTTNDEIGYTGDAINEMTIGLQERERLRHAMNLAMEVQQNLLPRKTPRIEGLDISGASIYCEETGGDYFDYFEWPETASAFGVVVADVSEHGISSALLMASLRACLRQRMAWPDDIGRVTEDVNRQLAMDVEDTGRFATMFLSIFDRSNMGLRWVNAGHDSAFVYDPRTDRFTELGRTGLALGVSENSTHREAAHDLSPGQVVVIATDGIWEACNHQAEMFGKARLHEIIRRMSPKPANAIIEEVMHEVNGHCGTVRKADDLTLVVIKIT